MSHVLQQSLNLYIYIFTGYGDDFLKQRQPVDLCDGHVLCFACGAYSILKYHLDELRLQRGKMFMKCYLVMCCWSLYSAEGRAVSR
jgi:hypothetical protein